MNHNLMLLLFCLTSMRNTINVLGYFFLFLTKFRDKESLLLVFETGANMPLNFPREKSQASFFVQIVAVHTIHWPFINEHHASAIRQYAINCSECWSCTTCRRHCVKLELTSATQKSKHVVRSIIARSHVQLHLANSQQQGLHSMA